MIDVYVNQEYEVIALKDNGSVLLVGDLEKNVRYGEETREMDLTTATYDLFDQGSRVEGKDKKDEVLTSLLGCISGKLESINGLGTLDSYLEEKKFEPQQWDESLQDDLLTAMGIELSDEPVQVYNQPVPAEFMLQRYSVRLDPDVYQSLDDWTEVPGSLREALASITPLQIISYNGELNFVALYTPSRNVEELEKLDGVNSVVPDEIVGEPERRKAEFGPKTWKAISKLPQPPNDDTDRNDDYGSIDIT